MRNRTKKVQKELDAVYGLLVLVAGLIGWYQLGSLKGVGIAVGVMLVIILVVSLWRTERFKKRLRLSGIDTIDGMTGRQFEEYVGVLFENDGYRVTYTPATGDYGADLILKKGQDVIVVQAKRYNQSVGIKAVQEVIPAVNMYHANDAWVISNSYYTKAAKKLAESNSVRLINRDELIRLGIRFKQRQEAIQPKTTENQTVDSITESPGKTELAATKEVEKVNISEDKLETLLKEFRLKRSRQTGVKAYHVFTNKTLEELVTTKPDTIGELKKISGIGEKKIVDFGEELVRIIREYKLG